MSRRARNWDGGRYFQKMVNSWLSAFIYSDFVCHLRSIRVPLVARMPRVGLHWSRTSSRGQSSKNLWEELESGCYTKAGGSFSHMQSETGMLGRCCHILFRHTNLMEYFGVHSWFLAMLKADAQSEHVKLSAFCFEIFIGTEHYITSLAV